MELVPGVSIENLLQQRNAMVERIHVAHVALTEVHALASAMFAEEFRGYYLSLLVGPSRRDFATPTGEAELVKEIDGRAWSYLLQMSGLQSFLDATAREKWRTAIEKNDVPPLTLENIEATFSTLYQQRGEMFERGVVAVFRALSWDYKTNTPKMFGKRLILRRIVETWGYGNFRGTGVSHSGADQLDDLVRVMSILDGKPEPDSRYATWRKLNDLGWMRYHECVLNQFAVLDYFNVRGFKNGNGHLTFTRLDLVDKLNQILAKHHPNALAPSEEAAA